MHFYTTSTFWKVKSIQIPPWNKNNNMLLEVLPKHLHLKVIFFFLCSHSKFLACQVIKEKHRCTTSPSRRFYFIYLYAFSNYPYRRFFFFHWYQQKENWLGILLYFNTYDSFLDNQIIFVLSNSKITLFGVFILV